MIEDDAHVLRTYSLHTRQHTQKTLKSYGKQQDVFLFLLSSEHINKNLVFNLCIRLPKKRKRKKNEEKFMLLFK